MSTIATVETLREIAEALADLDAEYRVHCDEPYVTIPVSYHTAVEVDADPVGDHLQGWLRSWDHTGGLLVETEIGTYASKAQALGEVRIRVQAHLDAERVEHERELADEAAYAEWEATREQREEAAAEAAEFPVRYS